MVVIAAGTRHDVDSAAIAAFDRLAGAYDALAEGEAFVQQRAHTHGVFQRWFRPGFRVLEIGCGTGVDTEFLASSGVHVVACDPSVEMLARAKRRLAKADLTGRATILSCGLQDLGQFLGALHRGPGFDAIVSNFGALNCVPSLAPLGGIARRHLRPGGTVVLGLMGRTCLSETVYFALSGRSAQLARRRRPVAVVPVAGIAVPTFYHQLSDVRSALGAGFAHDKTIAIGVLVPPPYLEPHWQRLPARARRAAARFDRLTASWPIVNQLGDHTLSRWVKDRAVNV